jgi:hypothetical protein
MQQLIIFDLNIFLDLKKLYNIIILYFKTTFNSIYKTFVQDHTARAQSGGRRSDHLYNLIVIHARRSNPRARETHGPPPSRSHCDPPPTGAGIGAL